MNHPNRKPLPWRVFCHGRLRAGFAQKDDALMWARSSPARIAEVFQTGAAENVGLVALYIDGHLVMPNERAES